jgi:hypothetical protein
MNFTFTWIMDKLGYMPKIDMEIGKVNVDTQSPEFKMWPFPVEQEKPKKQGKKVTTRKPAVKKPVAKKATKVAKKAK